MSAATLEVLPITDVVGVELVGLDLTAPTAATIAALRDAVDVHHVAVVRGQFLTGEQHRRLAECFGPLLAAPVQRLRGEAAAVSTIEDNAARPPAGFPWHTDLSWTAEPPELGFLSAVTIPATGGDTQWVSTAALYDQLSPAEQRWCGAAAAVHAPDARLLASIERHHGAAVASRLRASYPPVVHPLVRVHPRTGRRSLFVSPLYVRRLIGPSGESAPALLHRLEELLDDPRLQLRWRWREGDVVVWDETATVHRALTDHAPRRRVMRRCVTGQRAPGAGTVTA
jgi:taurine dioxygenase